jgi:hypothetical protein
LNLADLEGEQRLLSIISKVMPGVQFFVDPTADSLQLRLQRHFSGRKAGPLSTQVCMPTVVTAEEFLSYVRTFSPPGSELFIILGEGVLAQCPQIYPELAPLASGVLFDSSLGVPGLRLIDLTPPATALIDLHWLSLLYWRDAVKQIFGLPIFQQGGSRHRDDKDIQQISCTLFGGDSSEHRMFLFLGWMADAVGWTPRAFFRQGFECTTREGSVRTLGYDVEPGAKGEPELSGSATTIARGSPSKSLIFELSIIFGDSTQIRLSGNGETGILFQSFGMGVDEERIFPNQRISRLEAAARYFLVGESVINYRGAVRMAEEFRRLWRGYRHSVS